MSNKLNLKAGRKFYKQVLLFSMTLIVIITLTISAVIYIFLDHSVNDTIRRNETFNAMRISQNFTEELDIVSSIINSFAIMDPIPVDQLEYVTQLWIRRSVHDTLESYLRNYDYIAGISVDIAGLSSSSGQLYTDTFSSVCQYQGITISLCDTWEWPYYIQFKNNESLHSMNPVILQVKAEKLADSVFPVRDSMRKEYIINEDGMILLSEDSSDIFRPLSSLFELDIKNDSVTTFRQQNRDYYVIRHKVSEDLPFYYVSLVDADYYHSTVQSTLIKCLIIGFTLLSIAIVAVYFIVNYTYRPIRKILETLKYYSQDVSFYKNEIQFIHTQIEKNIQDKQHLEEALPKAIEKLYLAQVRTLQAQINPHFLFNTLENIKSLSIKKCGIDNEIEQSLVYLNGILFESINRENILTSVADEIRITNLYIALMQLRYSDCFAVEWDVTPDVHDLNIIRFTLQPLVENCILKGFRHNRTGYHIQIRISRMEEILTVTVSDNGHGMSAEKLQELYTDLADLETTPIGSIGLKNIHLRIRLLFGDNFGIRNITSSTQGTTVALTLPVIQGSFTFT